MLTTANYQVENLVGQYKLHGSLIIAFDYDDTVMPCNFPEALCIRPRELLIRAQKEGHVLVLFTSNPDTQKATAICHELGIYPKENPVSLQGNKAYYNVFLDDKCGLDEACNILEETLNILDSHLLKSKEN